MNRSYLDNYSFHLTQISEKVDNSRNNTLGSLFQIMKAHAAISE